MKKVSQAVPYRVSVRVLEMPANLQAVGQMISEQISILNRQSGEFSVLVEGEHALSYERSARELQRLRGQLVERGVRQSDYLEFRCEHGLAGALLWLVLLEAGHSFFVSAAGASFQHASAPGFCRYRVSAHWNDGLKLSVEERTNWTGALARVGDGLIFFRTSGTSGTAKLVAHTHRHLRDNALNCAKRLQLQSTDRLAIPVPIYHMYGLGAAFLPGVLTGASIDFQPAANLLSYLDRERKFQPNIAFLTPTFMESLVRGRRGQRPYALTVVAGDRLKPTVFREYEARFGPIISLYGSTELGAVSAALKADEAEERECGVGRVMDGVECKIDGQLWCRHPHGFVGYGNENGDLEERKADEWFATNDSAQWNHGDCLQILGRMDHSVNRDGVLIALSQVEAAMEGIPCVVSVKMVVSGSSSRGKGVVAFCILANGSGLTAGQVRKACFEVMPGSHVPDRVEVVEVFPLLANGKLDRVMLTHLAERGRV